MYTYNYSYGYSLGYSGGYNPYINYTWQMLPNAKVKNSGTSGVDLQLYSGNPLDFQATQGVQVNKSFTLSGNAISLFLGFDTDSIAITQTLAEFDNLKVSIANTTLKVTINAVEHNVATIALNTYYQTEIVINSNNLTVKLNGTQTYSASCTALNTTMLKSLGANDGLASGRFDGQFDYFIAYNGLTTFRLPNQFFKDMSINSNTLFCTDFRGNSSNIKDYKSEVTHPITNYSATQRTNFTRESKGLQDLTRLFDSNGFFVDNVSYLNCNGKGYGDTGWIPNSNSNFTIEVIRNKDTFQFFEGLWDDGIGRLAISTEINGSIRIDVGIYVQYIAMSGLTPEFTYIGVSYKADTKEVKIYENGTLKHTFITNFTSSGNSYPLGKRSNDNSVFANSIKRLFKVHNKVLTQEEITKNYNDYVAQGLLI